MENYYPNQHKNWFERNWKWFVPTGCLTLIVIIALFATAVFFGVTSIMKNSDVYQHGMAVAQKNKYVVEKIGNNIQENGMSSGSINTSNDSGNALLDIPIKGSKGKGLLHIEAEKRNNTWTYGTIDFYPEGSSEPINLLDPIP
jgi:hypothetical protein